MKRKIFCSTIFALFSATAFAGPEAFVAGPAIPDYGKIAPVKGAAPFPEGAHFKVRFDTREQADAGGLNRTFTSAARFINMHAAAGVPLDKLELAIVIHGGAVHDVVNATRYALVSEEKENANAALIAALMKKGVKFYVCGQSAAYYDVEKEDLLPEVELSLSAMTAHALLDAEGYSLNPF